MQLNSYASMGSWIPLSARCSRPWCARIDGRRRGGCMCDGLMLDGQRKSMQPMAARLRVDHQRLQQFVTSSPWEVEPVRKACALIQPHAWMIDDTGLVKDGASSACVARQYTGTLGKVGNCQVAVSVHAASDAASAPLDWRLYVPPQAGTRTAPRTPPQRSLSPVNGARSPDSEHHRPKWQMALETADSQDTDPHTAGTSMV